MTVIMQKRQNQPLIVMAGMVVLLTLQTSSSLSLWHNRPILPCSHSMTFIACHGKMKNAKRTFVLHSNTDHSNNEDRSKAFQNSIENLFEMTQPSRSTSNTDSDEVLFQKLSEMGLSVDNDDDAPFLNEHVYLHSDQYLQSDGSIRMDSANSKNHQMKELTSKIIDSAPSIPKEYYNENKSLDDNEKALHDSLFSQGTQKQNPEELHQSVFANEAGFFNQSQAFRDLLTGNTVNTTEQNWKFRRGMESKQQQDKATQQLKNDMTDFLKQNILSEEEIAALGEDDDFVALGEDDTVVDFTNSAPDMEKSDDDGEFINGSFTFESTSIQQQPSLQQEPLNTKKNHHNLKMEELASKIIDNTPYIRKDDDKKALHNDLSQTTQKDPFADEQPDDFNQFQEQQQEGKITQEELKNEMSAFLKQNILTKEDVTALSKEEEGAICSQCNCLLSPEEITWIQQNPNQKPICRECHVETSLEIKNASPYIMSTPGITRNQLLNQPLPSIDDDDDDDEEEEPPMSSDLKGPDHQDISRKQHQQQPEKVDPNVWRAQFVAGSTGERKIAFQAPDSHNNATTSNRQRIEPNAWRNQFIKARNSSSDLTKNSFTTTHNTTRTATTTTLQPPIQQKRMDPLNSNTTDSIKSLINNNMVNDVKAPQEQNRPPLIDPTVWRAQFSEARSSSESVKHASSSNNMDRDVFRSQFSATSPRKQQRASKQPPPPPQTTPMQPKVQYPTSTNLQQRTSTNSQQQQPQTSVESTHQKDLQELKQQIQSLKSAVVSYKKKAQEAEQEATTLRNLVFTMEESLTMVMNDSDTTNDDGDEYNVPF